MHPVPDSTENYLENLVSGDSARLLAGFAVEPVIDDPLGGEVRSLAAFERFYTGRHVWLIERRAQVETFHITHDERRTVCETLLHLHLPDREVALPVAVVGDRTAHNRLLGIRVYHSLWPLIGDHRVRAPLLPHDPALTLGDVIAEYQQALFAGDVAAIVDTFETDGYFREPAGGAYIYRGRAQLRDFMAHLLASGGIRLEHCTATDDGVACAPCSPRLGWLSISAVPRVACKPPVSTTTSTLKPWLVHNITFIY
jgi:SnoaL-like domain